MRALEAMQECLKVNKPFKCMPSTDGYGVIEDRFGMRYLARYSFTIVRISLLLLLLSGCSSVSNKARVVQTDQGIGIIHSPSDEQFSYVKKHKSLTRSCTQTNIDTSITSAGGFTVSAAGESIGDETSTGELTMGGRDPTVLITRELMYRSCELSLNLNLKPEDATKIYTGTLDVLIGIVKSHKGVGTSSVSASAEKIDMLPTKKSTPPALDSTKPADESTTNQVNSDFSGFSWSDYPSSPNTFNSSHP
jgi:hypothetical protein